MAMFAEMFGLIASTVRTMRRLALTEGLDSVLRFDLDGNFREMQCF
jgi:hypothetical protein